MAADTGPIGGNLSHEFIILADTGESKIYTDKRIFDVNFEDSIIEKKSLKSLRSNFEKYYAVTDEKFNKNEFEKNVPKEHRLTTKGIEVGHIFYFGDKYSNSMKASVDHQGKKVFVKMGSYGVGVSRLVGAIIEAKYDDKNEIMKWPVPVAPYECAILDSGNKVTGQNVSKKALYIIDKLKGIDLIVDDTEDNISSKIKKFNLIGVPYQIILGSKTPEDSIEFREVGKESQIIKMENLLEISKTISDKRN
jgi:prolyl-tRNA synthetase